MIIGRRAFLRGLVSALAAPAIVRAASLMPVRVMPPVEELDALDDDFEYNFRISIPLDVWRSLNMGVPYG